MRDLYCIRDVVLYQGYCTVQGLLTCVMRLEMYPVLEDRVMFPGLLYDGCRAVLYQGCFTVLGLLTCVMRLEM